MGAAHSAGPCSSAPRARRIKTGCVRHRSEGLLPRAPFPKKPQSWLPSCSIIHPPQLMITQNLISGVFQHLRCEMPIFGSLALQEICRTRGLKHVSSSFFVYISLRACWLLKNLFRWCSNALHEKALRFVLRSLARLPCDLLLSLWATYKKIYPYTSTFVYTWATKCNIHIYPKRPNVAIDSKMAGTT